MKLATRISLLTVERAWWRSALFDDSTVREDFANDVTFKSGRATLLTSDGSHVEAIARGGSRSTASDFRDVVTFEHIRPLQIAVPVHDLAACIRPRAKRAGDEVFHGGSGLLS